MGVLEVRDRAAPFSKKPVPNRYPKVHLYRRVPENSAFFEIDVYVQIAWNRFDLTAYINYSAIASSNDKCSNYHGCGLVLNCG